MSSCICQTRLRNWTGQFLPTSVKLAWQVWSVTFRSPRDPTCSFSATLFLMVTPKWTMSLRCLAELREGSGLWRGCATACKLTVEALASGCTHNFPCGLMLLLHSATVADLLPADVPALSRGESHHKTRLRKERPVPANGIEKVCGHPPASYAWASKV